MTTLHAPPLRRSHLALLGILGLLSAGVAPASAADGPGPRIVLMRPPGGGRQPQATIDREGTTHVVYLKGDPTSSDVEYTRLAPGSAEFAKPIQVNHVPGSAIAVGTIRGAQIATGRDGHLHIVWNGSKNARPENPNGGAPLLYTRSDPSRTGFEPERNLMRTTTALDGGATVAADGEGRVLVAWHGKTPGATDGEVGRKLYVARSTDDGQTFAAEAPALDAAISTGACACCGTRALAGRSGAFHVLYRAATEGTKRDMLLLTSRDGGQKFALTRLHPWNLNMCPMSSESLVEGPAGVLAAWETQGQVYVARVDPKTGEPATPTRPRGSGGNRKHPSLACNAKGEWLLAWAEDTSFQRGGSLAWRLFGADGKPTEEAGRIEGGIPANGLPTAVALPDGRFLIIH